MSEQFSTFVFAAPGRDRAHQILFESIAKSDLGEYEICLHPEGITAWEHWEATHRKAAASPTPFVLVLEDDCLVNRHFRHNLESWRWKHDKAFGAGWLFNCGGWGGAKDSWYKGPWEWYGTQAVLYRTSLLERFVESALVHYRETKLLWDVCVSWAVHAEGYQIRVHAPPLVEHLDHLPSKLGNAPHAKFRTTWGSFKSDWKRAAGDVNGIRRSP